MNEIDPMEQITKFHKSLKQVFEGESGKFVLDFLIENYVESSAISETTELTYYRLGQKELIQGLVKDIKCIPDLKNIMKTDLVGE